MATLFDVGVPAVNKHLNNVFVVRELQREATVSKMELVQQEGDREVKIVKTDVSIAKNYLRENELEAMGHIVNAFLDVAEDMAKRHIPMTMEDWAKRIDKFLDVTDRPVLLDSGRVSADDAKWYAESEFEKYRLIQDRLFQSDFDRFDDDGMLPLSQSLS